MMGDKGGEGEGKGDGSKGTTAVLRPSLFEPKSVAEMQGEYKISEPYRHLVIPDLMDSEVLKTACEELKSNMQATLKETDIFKVSFVACWCTFDMCGSSCLVAQFFLSYRPQSSCREIVSQIQTMEPAHGAIRVTTSSVSQRDI